MKVLSLKSVYVRPYAEAFELTTPRLLLNELSTRGSLEDIDPRGPSFEDIDLEK